MNIIKVLESSDIEYLSYSIESLKNSMYILKLNLPALSMIIALSFIFISLIYAMNTLRKRGVILNQKYRFIHFRISENMIIPIAILSICIYLARHYQVSNFNILFNNSVTFSAFYFYSCRSIFGGLLFYREGTKGILRVFIPLIIIF